MTTESVVVLEPGDGEAQKIAKAMASQTATDILALLSSGQKSLSDITENLRIPLTTAKYHAENLLDAGLITVSETRYSIKGREVKMYALSNRLLIVAPKRTNIRDLLLKYSSLFVIVAAGTLAVFAYSPFLSASTAQEVAAPFAAPSGAGIYTTRTVVENTLAKAPFMDPALTFLLGGLVVIGALFCYDAYRWKQNRNNKATTLKK